MPQPKKKDRQKVDADTAGYARTKVTDPTHLFYTTRDVSLLQRLTPQAVRMLGASFEDVYNRDHSR